MSRRLALALLRAVAGIVPARDRAAWLQEWEAELAYQKEIRMRRVLGSFFDAAWLRRQLTRDAEIVQDVRHGARVLRSSPAFAVTAIVVLALGIGVTVGIFSVVDTLLVRQLPYADAGRVAMLWQAPPDDAQRRAVSPGLCHDWLERLAAFETLACVEPLSFDYVSGGDAIVVRGAAVTAGFFQAIGTDVLVGRTFAPEEHVTGRDRVAILSHRFWRQAYGEAPGAIGSPIVLDGDRYVIAGVLPASFEPRLTPSDNDSYSEPAVYVPKVLVPQERRFRGSGGWNVVGRLKPGATLAQAQTELDRVAADLGREYPRTDAGRAPRVQPLREHLAGNLAPALRLLLASVAVVLLIASANVAHLLLARAAGRTRELAVRSAVGASRGRVVRQLMTESLLLAALGSIAGLGVAWLTIRAIAGLSPGSITSLNAVTIDGRVMLFAIALTATVAVVVGFVPAVLTTKARLVDALRGILMEEVLGRRQSLRSAIVIAEVALAVLLITGAALLLRSFGALLSTNPGFDPERVVALQVFAWDRNTTPERRIAFFRDVLSRMAADPRVTSAGAVSAMPLIEANIDIATPVLADRPLPPDNDGSTPGFLTFATAGYFETMGVTIASGRALTDGDRMETRRVALVSEALARRAFGVSNPVGRSVSFRYQGRPVQADVVGVFTDIRHDGLDRPARSEIIAPLAQFGFGSMTFVARTAGPAADAIAALKGHIRAVDPLQAIYRSATAEELVSLSLVERRFMLALLGAFAVLAGVLAAVGIYGVMSVVTSQRMREFGVRLALGARRHEIVRIVVTQAATMVGIGLAIGVAGALAFGKVMTRFLYGVSPADPLTLAGTLVLLGLAGALACLLPARRATRADPLVTLKAD